MKKFMMELINKHEKETWSQWVSTVTNITEVDIYTEAIRIINYFG